MVVVPVANAVTSPPEETVATDGLLLFQMSPCGAVEGVTAPDNCTVSPIFSVFDAGVIVTLCGISAAGTNSHS